MPKDVTALFRDASELPERDRATLAGLVIESLEAETVPDVEGGRPAASGSDVTSGLSVAG